jgi:hypothetical protein
MVLANTEPKASEISSRTLSGEIGDSRTLAIELTARPTIPQGTMRLK